MVRDETSEKARDLILTMVNYLIIALLIYIAFFKGGI
jgi:hypothetical protein